MRRQIRSIKPFNRREVKALLRGDVDGLVHFVKDLPPEDIGDLARAQFKELRLGEFEPYIKRCIFELQEHGATTRVTGDKIMTVTAEHLPRGAEFGMAHKILAITTFICLSRSHKMVMEEFSVP